MRRHHAVACQRIEVRRRNFAPVTTEVAPTHVVHKNDDDVRLGRAGGSEQTEAEKKRCKPKEVSFHRDKQLLGGGELVQPLDLRPLLDWRVLLRRARRAATVADIITHQPTETLYNFWMLTTHVGLFRRISLHIVELKTRQSLCIGTARTRKTPATRIRAKQEFPFLY